MEGYPAEYTEHNLPLVLLTGLDAPQHATVDSEEARLLQRGGFVISSDLPPVTGERVQQLVQELQSCNGDEKPWHSRAVSDQNSYFGFRIKSVGRRYVLPPRKADHPRESTGYSPPHSPSIPSSPNLVLHSPLSPLSPDAPVYPDGLMVPLWLKKHQEYIPAAQISLFSFTNDANVNSLNDNKLKSDINQMNSSMRSSGYKTRLVVVLVADRSILEASDIDDRLAGIKRATGLDSKNSLFLLPPTLSNVELSNFAGSVLAALQPYCVEYYRDLTKHARRKKGRGAIPPPTVAPTKGTSQALAALGWSIRYDFKLGVFAEFRQEMDAAGRHYNAVLDALLSSDGVFETTASWSPRWDETRLLADCAALRLIRTLLWSSTTTLAVRTWVNYRDRVRELVDRRGKGSSNYGWEAWESRWARVMAELVQRAELPVFQLPPAPAEPESLLSWILNIFAPPEKSIPVGERLPPWHLLHHSGYWQRLAGAHAKSRRSLAKELPAEDRTPPGQSPAAVVASRHNTYETYLCPDPHEEMPTSGSGVFNHAKDIVDKYTHSGKDFRDRSQQRTADQCVLEQAQAFMDAENYGEALAALTPLWKNMQWRSEKWYEAVHTITRALNTCAMHHGDSKILVLTNWELMSNVFPTPGKALAEQHRQRTDAITSGAGKVEVTLTDGDVISPLSAKFNFPVTQGHVADRLACQLVLTSQANPESEPMKISLARVELEGSISSVEITHEPGSPTQAAPTSRLVTVDLTEVHESLTRSSYTGTADLTLQAGHCLVLEMELVFRDAGSASVDNTTVTVDGQNWSLTQICRPALQESTNTEWWQERPSGLRPKRIPRREDGSLTVLPKPPKLEISPIKPRKAYFTDESATLDFSFVNGEDEEADVEVDVSIVDGSEEGIHLGWISEPMPTRPADEYVNTANTRKLLGKMAAGEERKGALRVSGPAAPSDCIVQIRAIYHLTSDTDTPVSKAFQTQLNFVSPFEANYDFAPRVHPDAWPSYFSVSEHLSKPASGDIEAVASGLKQRWSLSSKIVSFADEALTITAAELVVGTAYGSITTRASTAPFDPPNLTIGPQESRTVRHTIDVQKFSLDDRRASALETTLKLTWHRPFTPSSSSATATATPTTTTLRVPRLLIPQLEPRVLATSSDSAAVPGLKLVSYSIENPTIHFLTFDLTMEASEEFAVGGSKVGSVNVLPMSRVAVGYRVLPLVRGRWVAVGLSVVDRYFGKTLRVLAGDGVREGKDGVVEVWLDEEKEAGKSG